MPVNAHSCPSVTVDGCCFAACRRSIAVNSLFAKITLPKRPANWPHLRELQILADSHTKLQIFAETCRELLEASRPIYGGPRSSGYGESRRIEQHSGEEGYLLAQNVVRAAPLQNESLPPQIKKIFIPKRKSMPNMTGRSGRRTMDMNPVVPHSRPLRPLVLYFVSFIQVEAEGLLAYQGRAGIISIVRSNPCPVIFSVKKRPNNCLETSPMSKTHSLALFNILTSAVKQRGREKKVPPKRAKMVLCSFHRSHREICTRNRPLSETKFLNDPTL